MMRTSALFLLWCMLLGWAHCGNPDPGVLDQPISSFRDGSVPHIGYSLFLVLIATILSHGMSWWALREFVAAYMCLAVAGGLVVVAATPTNSSFHDFMALAVMTSGYLYFTVSLYREFLEWSDPFLRSIHRRGKVSMQIPPRERCLARIWRWTMAIHQGVLLLAVVLNPLVFDSGAILQKFIVTHLLLLLTILELLPRRRPTHLKGAALRKSRVDR